MPGTTRQALPPSRGGAGGVFTVEEKNYTVKKLQALAGQRHAIFHIVENETITYSYERNTNDPRILHRLVLETDPFGNILKEAQVAYARRIVPTGLDEQRETLVRYEEKFYINEDDNASFYRIGVPYQNKSYQVYGLSPAANGKFDAGILDEIANATAINYEDEYSGRGIQKRLLAHSRQYYYKHDLSAKLSLGQIASHALPYHSQNMAYTPGLLVLMMAKNDMHGTWHNNMLQAADLAKILVTTGKFVKENDHLWQVSGRQTFDATGFYLPLSTIDPFGNTTLLQYDTYKLLMGKVTDALGDETVVANDYYSLQPREITDPNLNHTEVAFDALGLVTATALKGKETAPSIWQGDTIADPTVSMQYDLHNWKNMQLPVYVNTRAREKHKDAQTAWLESYTYSDGLGRELQTKVQAEDGPAWQMGSHGQPEQVLSHKRWTATGRTIYNNKAKVVKQYEPWFSTTHLYEPEDELTQYGVTPVMHYDPVGRLVRTDLPDGNHTKVSFDAWKQENWDQNDTNQACDHKNTPQVQHYDTLGRLFLSQDDNGTSSRPDYYPTRQQYDIAGNITRVKDANEHWMTATLYNMTGEPVYTFNIDSGRRWLINDVAGKPIYRWNNRHQQFEHDYDTLQRPTSLSLRLSASAVYLVESTVYGTTTANNLKGQIADQYDQSGKTQFTAHDFKGNLLSLSKQLCQDYKQTIDWNRSPALETETFVQTFSYDAMNRPINISQPDNSLIAHSYNKAGLLETVKARLRGSTSWTDFVRDINYNEKGQRTEIYFANDSKTAYTYDDKTFRLNRLLTTRYKGQDVLQDLNYEYDPVGNITRITDKAQQTFYFNNSVIEPTAIYTYDALYRLTSATGREIKGLAMPTHNDFANNIALPNPAAHALQNYTRQFTYDQLGNIMQMKSKGYWTRDYFYNTGTNSLKGHTSGVTTYTYDEHGNTLTMPHLSRIKWDYADRLQYADLGGGGNAYYVYDASGERIRKVIEKGTVVEERIYLGGWEVYRKHISGNLNFERETLRIFDDTKAIAQIETKTVENGIEVQPIPNIRYQYDNHLGSACLELDENAAIISYEEYHPFGTTSYRSGRTETEVSLKRYKNVGKERDEETGLYYYGARYYAGWLARFVSVDALAKQFPQFSPYVYSNDNPLRYTDPTGMQSEDEVDQVHPPTKPESKWNYSQELTESWYPDRQDLSIYTSDEFTILKQDVSTHDALHATDYYYLNEDNWKPFEPAKSTFKEDVEKFALYPILLSGGAVAGSILIESLLPLAVEGVKASVPYLAKGALAAAEEAGLAYEAAQGFVATNQVAAGIGLEFMMSNLPGVEPINNPYSSVYSETTRFLFTAYNLFKEKSPNIVIPERNYENMPIIQADNTYFQKPIDPIMRMDVLENKTKIKK